MNFIIFEVTGSYYRNYNYLNPMGVGQNIRTIRILKNRTQKFVADEIGISEKWLGKLENEVEEISEEYIEAISRVLQITPEEIKNFQDKTIFNNNTNSINNAGYNNKYHSNSSENIEKLYQQILVEKDKIIQTLQKEIDTLKFNK